MSLGRCEDVDRTISFFANHLNGPDTGGSVCLRSIERFDCSDSYRGNNQLHDRPAFSCLSNYHLHLLESRRKLGTAFRSGMGQRVRNILHYVQFTIRVQLVDTRVRPKWFLGWNDRLPRDSKPRRSVGNHNRQTTNHGKLSKRDIPSIIINLACLCQ